ncbi:MAG TPA: formate dehydrogenase accessory protein FdhE [Anaeromyxobacteraceae bacterium]|nr:formate dehydrogenase accessory protein FdhE [Anaeromyxobacteraceae bacterium]
MTEPQLVGGGDLGEPRYLRPPAGAVLFQRRAERLAALAPGHASGDYLEFLSRLCGAQREAAERLHLSPNGRDLPPSRSLDVAARPPPEWRDGLAIVLRALEQLPMPGPARDALQGLARSSAPDLDALAARLLRGDLGPGDLARAPFAGAALQVAYVSLAAGVAAESLPRPPDASCPVCDFPPVAGIVLADDKLRYLVCGLCGTEWHLPRILCAQCGRQERVSYYSVEGDEGPAKAEACDDCRAYTKLLYVEKAPHLEPFADDLATLALDMLMAERGYLRNGRNLFLASAEPGEPA